MYHIGMALHGYRNIEIVLFNNLPTSLERVKSVNTNITCQSGGKCEGIILHKL